MYKSVVLILLLSVGVAVCAQPAVSGDAVGRREESSSCQNRWSLSVGQQSLADTYLSPQQYKGLIFGLDAVHYDYYRNTDRVVWAFYDSWHYAPLLVNASHSAALQYASLNVGYATYYRWEPLAGLELYAGGMADIHGAVKLHGRNVNNIASADIEAQLYASAAVRWSHRWNKWGLALNYTIATPVIGTFFAPEMGQSYYELYLHLPRNIGDVVHFSSFHNRRGADGLFSVDFTFKSFAFFLAFNHNYQWHAANNITGYTDALQGRIGIRIDIANISNW